MSSNDPETLCILPEEVGMRIDLILSKRLEQHSRTYFQYLIDEGCVLCNGAPIKKRVQPKEGDEIEICFRATPPISLTPEKMDLNILFEDEHILAINKPVNMIIHPAPGNWSGTFVNALLAHCQVCAGDDPLRPGIVHRLDKQTTGVLIAAKTREAHQKLIEAFSQRQIDKTYLAICLNKPANGVIQTKIGRHSIKRKEMTVCRERGKESITSVEVIGFNERFSLIQAKPKTGRTHQIRVHLKHIGCPILGDEVYGSEKANRDLNAPRLLLHAHLLKLEHPIYKTPLILKAPLPDDFKHFASGLGPTT